jgi:hypothetical protein
MQRDADIIRRLMVSALWRRLPLWMAAVLPWVLLKSIAGMVAALAWAAWDFVRLQRTVTRDWTRWLDGSVAALEDSSAMLVQAESAIAKLQRNRLLERVDDALKPQVVKAIAGEHVRYDWRWPAVSILAALAWFVFQQKPVAAAATVRLPGKAVATALSDIVVKVTPPVYTGVKPVEASPRDLQVPQASLVQWCFKPGQQGEGMIELSDGQQLKVGAACARWTASEAVFWRWRGKRYKLLVTPDEAPQVSISAPRDMLQILAPTSTSASMAVAIRDDYRITRASLHMTLARGSGENVRFTDREVPLPASSNPKERNWSRSWSLAELGVEPGDDLYFFVRATDNAEPPHTTVSPTYTLRLPAPLEAEDETTALPMLVKPENLRSQRQIIIDTEQLIADVRANPRLPAATLRARSEAIAGDQGVLRRRYGKFMGEESSLFGGEEEHHEEGESKGVVAEYGHAHDEAENATLFDEATKKILRRALAAMWDAERELRAISPKTALPHEYKALAAIKELQQADRIYLHKTAFTPPPLKEELRMTGDVVGASSYKREQAGPSEAIPADVKTLLQALSADGALPALWSRTAQDWIRARIVNDDQRLEAQKAVQDVADGCTTCRPVLRAWLRGAIVDAPILLQARPEAQTQFTRAWRKGASK